MVDGVAATLEKGQRYGRRWTSTSAASRSGSFRFPIRRTMTLGASSAFRSP